MLTRMLHWIVALPWVYDLVQKLAGRDRNYARLAPLIAQARGGTLLDVGAGTGDLQRIVPPDTTYIWLDNDPQKLSGFQKKSGSPWALLGETNQMGLRDKSVDIAVCACVSHHLTDTQLGTTLREMARVCRMRLVFLDPIRVDHSATSKLLWKYDRGSFPRRREALRSAIEQYFEIEHEEGFSIYHHYWLCTGKPKASAAWA